MPLVGLLGYNLPAPIAELLQMASTSFTDSSVTIATAPYGKKYEVGDIARFTDRLGIFGASAPMTFAEDAVVSANMLRTNVVANLTDGFTAQYATSGTDLTLAGLVSAINTLEINTKAEIGPGEAMFVGHPVQFGDLRTNCLTIGGAVQWMPATADFVAIKGSGYRGQLFGVDLMSSSQVPTANAGADRAGGLFMRGAIVLGRLGVFAEGSDQFAIGGEILFERRRVADLQTDFLMSLHIGGSIAINDCGVSVITDA